MKSCPFCGSKKLNLNRTNESACWVSCDRCGSEAESASTREEAIFNWDGRPKVTDDAAFVVDDEASV